MCTQYCRCTQHPTARRADVAEDMDDAMTDSWASSGCALANWSISASQLHARSLWCAHHYTSPFWVRCLLFFCSSRTICCLQLHILPRAFLFVLFIVKRGKNRAWSKTKVLSYRVRHVAVSWFTAQGNTHVAAVSSPAMCHILEQPGITPYRAHGHERY